MNDMSITKPIDKLLTALTAPTSLAEIAKRLVPNDALQAADYHFFQINSLSHISDAPRREALENVLIPYKTSENINMLKEAGFQEVEVCFKWYNFTGIIARKL